MKRLPHDVFHIDLLHIGHGLIVKQAHAVLVHHVDACIDELDQLFYDSLVSFLFQRAHLLFRPLSAGALCQTPFAGRPAML